MSICYGGHMGVQHFNETKSPVINTVKNSFSRFELNLYRIKLMKPDPYDKMGLLSYVSVLPYPLGKNIFFSHFI